MEIRKDEIMGRVLTEGEKEKQAIMSCYSKVGTPKSKQ